MIEKIADDLIGQMTEARLIDKEMEARYVYVFICWIEKFITVGSIIVISLMFHKLLPTIFFLVFFLELRKRTGGYHGIDRFPPACMGIFHQPKRPIIQKKSER